MNVRQDFYNHVKCMYRSNPHIYDVDMFRISILLTKKGLAQKNYQIS